MVHRQALTLKQLRAFAAVVEAGSLTAAAGVLHVTPSAVSTQLRRLEEILGARTLERGRDGRVKLTPVGEQVLATVREIERALEDGFQRVDALAAALAGEDGPVSPDPR